jgi:hypothetical protein
LSDYRGVDCDIQEHAVGEFKVMIPVVEKASVDDAPSNLPSKNIAIKNPP